MGVPVAPSNSIQSMVVDVSFSGGIVGMFTSRNAKIQRELQRWNDQGYSLKHIIPPSPNFLEALFEVLILICTFAIWCPRPGLTLIFERAPGSPVA